MRRPLDAWDEDDDDDADPRNSRTFAQLLQDAPGRVFGVDAIPYDCADELDPNIVADNEMTGLQSGQEDDDIYDYSSDSSIASESDGEVDIDENQDRDMAALERVLSALTPEQRTQLHMDVEGSSRVFSADELRDMSLHGWNVLPENVAADPVPEAPSDKRYDGYFGPSADILPSSSSIIDLFFYFLPKSFWSHVASESNRYWRQTFDSRLNQAFENQSGRKKLTRDQIEAKMMKFKRIFPHEIVKWVGLMLAHVLCPQKRMRFHWSTSTSGALPAGTFGKVMSRERFEEISRFLHFSDNTADQAKTDRAWKIRPILTTLEKTFKNGYVLGYRVALDEGMLPSRNRHNPTRTYMKDKPHKWGSKCVMTCCATSGYCKR